MTDKINLDFLRYASKDQALQKHAPGIFYDGDIDNKTLPLCFKVFNDIVEQSRYSNIQGLELYAK